MDEFNYQQTVIQHRMIITIDNGEWFDRGNLMKNLKYEHQGIFPLLGRVKLNFRDR